MTRGLALTAAIAALSGSAHAATYTWTGTNNTTTDWGDTTKWVDESAVAGNPKANDLAKLLVPITSYTYLDIKAGGAVGSVYARPQWDQTYRIKSSWTGQRTFTFNNGTSPSVVTLSSATDSAIYTGSLVIGQDDKSINVQLASDLLVNNDGSRKPSGRLTLGALATITGGTASARRTITTQSLGTGKSTTSVNGSATFIGDWVVDVANASLDMNANGFGDASNSVDLINGGTLDLTHAAFDPASFSWNRSLSGTGRVLANANGFTVGTGSFDLSGNGITTDRLSITGNLTLSPNSVLNLSGTFSGDSIPLVTATGTVTGKFGTVNLPAGYGIEYSGNGITLVVPEPAAITLGCGLGMLAIGRRRRTAGGMREDISAYK